MIVLEKMSTDKKPFPTQPTLTSTSVIEEVLRKYSDGLVSQEVLSGALESSVNRLENSGASAIESAGDLTAGSEPNNKTTKAKASNKSRSSNFRLYDVVQQYLGVQHSMFEMCTPSFSSATPIKREGNDTASPTVSRDHPIELDLDEDKETGEESASSLKKKPRHDGESTGAGRWLQICSIDAKIWVEC